MVIQSQTAIETELYTILKTTFGNKQALSIARVASSYVIAKIKQTKEEYSKQFNNNNSGSYFDVVGKPGGQSISDNDAKTFNRAHMRTILINAIETAASDELKLKHIVELNKFDDNYQHASKDTPLIIELTQYKVDPNWCKSMCSRGLCIADDTSTG